MDISSPQFRESIIAMDGEIVRPRVRTIAQAAALTPRANVAILKDDSVAEYYMPRFIIADDNTLVRIKIVAIPAWNMNTTTAMAVNHGLTMTDILFVTGKIRHDNGVYWYFFWHLDTADFDYEVQWGIEWIDATRVNLMRKPGGIFNDAAFQSVAFDRGELYIFHKEP